MSNLSTTGVLLPAEVDKRLIVAQFSAAGPKDYKIVENADGTGSVQGLKVFKAGTFKDSMGEERTWTADHLALMVSNFNLLKNNGTFPNVPNRADHVTSINGVVGYFNALTTDGAFLYADIDFTEPDGFGKFRRGTYRGRSLEVGFYEANDNSLYWPVVLGVAWVDVPAVEGLYSNSQFPHAFISDKEIDPVTAPKDDKVTTFRVNGSDTSDFAAVQAHIASLEARKPHTFRVNGADTTDANIVQTHISTLETFAAEQRDSGRQEFVKGLVTSGKIGAPQEASLIELVVGTKDSPGMTDAQYAAFKASYDAAPVLDLFKKHGVTITNQDGQDGKLTPEQQKVADDTEIVAMHRRAGMTDEQLSKVPSYQRLQAAQARK